MRYLLLIVAICCTQLILAQSSFMPLNGDAYRIVERFDIKYGKVLPVSHTNVKPYSRVWTAQYAQHLTTQNIKFSKQDRYNIKYLYQDNSEWLTDTTINSKKSIFKVFYKEPAHLYSVHVKDFDLSINPVLQVMFGYEFGDGVSENPDNGFRFMNTRGAEVRFNIKKKLSFYTYFTDTQMRNMLYVQRRILGDQAVPGEGFYKDGFRETGVDYFTARGYMTFNVLDHIDFQFGHDRNFIGNGIRSLFLSDYSNNYLFLKMQTRIWRIEYTSLFTQMTGTYVRGGDQLLPKKFGAFHHLNVNITHWLDIGLFEGVIHNREDGFDFAYLNPLIFYRAIEQALGSPDNALIGLDFKANIARHLQLYGQFVLDEFNFANIRARNGWWANKFGLQAGGKYIDAFGVSTLDLQAEFNWVRPYVYTHTSAENTYTNYNQPLAHPLGANFWEIIAIARYQVTPELMLRGKILYAQKGEDEAGTNWGGNIFLATTNDQDQLAVEREFGNVLLQGVQNNVLLVDLLASYQVRHNIYVDLNLIMRNLSGGNTAQNGTQVYAGIGARMNIPYRSWDF